MRQSRLEGQQSIINYHLPKNSSDFKTTGKSDAEASSPKVRRTRKYSDLDNQDSESLGQKSERSLLTELDTLQEYIEIHEAEYDECVDEFEKEERLKAETDFQEPKEFQVSDCYSIGSNVSVETNIYMKRLRDVEKSRQGEKLRKKFLMQHLVRKSLIDIKIQSGNKNATLGHDLADQQVQWNGEPKKQEFENSYKPIIVNPGNPRQMDRQIHEEIGKASLKIIRQWSSKKNLFGSFSRMKGIGKELSPMKIGGLESASGSPTRDR